MKYSNEVSKVLKKYEYVGVNTLLVKNNKMHVSSHGFEVLNEKNLTKDTIFRIASVSKVIIALGILKLYEEKKLKIDDDISNYLGYKVRNPYFLDYPITIEMLMTQTSSISDGADDNLGYDGVNGPHIEVFLKDLLTNPNYEFYLDRTFTNHIPGTYFEYSNFNCGILACIIEKVSGVYFSDYIREKILLPLEIDGSFLASDIIHKENIASLYDYRGSFNLQRNKEMFLKGQFPRYNLGDNFRMPAGGLFISIFDLQKIMQMLMNYGTYQNVKIFEKETIEYMKEIHWSGESMDPEYKKKGLQLLILDIYKERLYGHFGCAYGLRSYMLFNDNIGMIFISNGADFKENKERGITDMQDEMIKLMFEYEDE